MRKTGSNMLAEEAILCAIIHPELESTSTILSGSGAQQKGFFARELASLSDQRFNIQ